MYRPNAEFLPLPETETPVELDQVGKDLMKAAEYIREHGWCQRLCKDAQGRVCALGAILEIAPNDSRRVCAAMHAADEFVGGGHTQLTEWNNAPERTADEVIRALEDCARARSLIGRT